MLRVLSRVRSITLTCYLEENEGQLRCSQTVGLYQRYSECPGFLATAYANIIYLMVSVDIAIDCKALSWKGIWMPLETFEIDS